MGYWLPMPNVTDADLVKRYADLVKRFTYHKPKDDQPARYEALREKRLELARLIVASTPGGREQALALTKLEESIMHANSAIARSE